ncbi:hypothetical protein Acsp02_95810 [Actinoplanes sp. NBRC 103695]|nr:hypothetical protein Acsp02_95810 [Actinoplanes sp. NBRC 103695]
MLTANYSAEEAPGLVGRVLDRHYAVIGEATGWFDKLRTIAETVVVLQIGRFHSRGNARLNVGLVLHRLLADEGFDPVVFPDMYRGFAGVRDIDALARSLADRQGRPLAEHLDIRDDHLVVPEVSPGRGAGADAVAVTLTDFLTGASPEPATPVSAAYERFTARRDRPVAALPALYSLVGANPAWSRPSAPGMRALLDGGLAGSADRDAGCAGSAPAGGRTRWAARGGRSAGPEAVAAVVPSGRSARDGRDLEHGRLRHGGGAGPLPCRGVACGRRLRDGCGASVPASPPG